MNLIVITFESVAKNLLRLVPVCLLCFALYGELSFTYMKGYLYRALQEL